MYICTCISTGIYVLIRRHWFFTIIISNLIVAEEIAMRKDPHARLKAVSAETKDILQQLEKDYKAPEKKENKKEVYKIIIKFFF